MQNESKLEPDERTFEAITSRRNKDRLWADAPYFLLQEAEA